jgi:hypothetical protein
VTTPKAKQNIAQGRAAHPGKPWKLAFFTSEERDLALEVFCQSFGDERVVNGLPNVVR